MNMNSNTHMLSKLIAMFLALTTFCMIDANAQTFQEQVDLSPFDAVAVQTEGRLKSFGSCLLYTSPSPRDRTRSRMPSSA